MGNPPDKNLRDRYRESLLESQVYRLLGMYVDGIEVTQAIQYYHAEDHLTDPADRQPDNSVRLTSGKPAWVRVYVRCGLLSNDWKHAT